MFQDYIGFVFKTLIVMLELYMCMIIVQEMLKQ